MDVIVITQDECLELASEVTDMLGAWFDASFTESEHAALAIQIAEWADSLPHVRVVRLA